MLYASAESGAQVIVLRGFYFNVERDRSVPGEIMLIDQEFMQLFILLLVLIKKKSTHKQQKRM